MLKTFNEKISHPITNSDQKFKEDVYLGLSSTPKFISSKYFYDKRGDEIFQEIMKLPEYYLTNAEIEILENSKDKILKLIDSKEPFELVDLGAEDALKTKILLNFFKDQKVDFTYVPVDISKDAIENNTARTLIH